MSDLEKRVEWLEMQMQLVHRTLDKIDRKTEPQYILREPTDEEMQAILDCVEDEPQTSGIPYKVETSSVCKTEPQTERSSE